MVAVPVLGSNFKDIWLMTPITAASANFTLVDVGGTTRALNTTLAFTGFAKVGIQDNTDWTAATYKTIYSHTGSGLVYGLIACVAGGAETTTFEVTIDGVLKTITITNANGERAVLLASGGVNTADFTTATNGQMSITALDSSTLSTYQDGAWSIPGPRANQMLGVPALRYDYSCLIRMKHSASITNSTATAYSAVMVRKGIAS